MDHGRMDLVAETSCQGLLDLRRAGDLTGKRCLFELR